MPQKNIRRRELLKPVLPQQLWRHQRCQLWHNQRRSH